MTPPHPSPRAVLVGLFVAALALRPQIVGVGPLIPRIQDDLDVSHAVAGLLGTIPVLCMGVFAPLTAVVAARVGTRAAMGLAVAAIGVFGILRAVAPSAWLVLLLTLPVGVGMAIGNTIMPLAVKERLPRRAAAGTGSYTTGIQVGALVAAALAIPLAAAPGDWRFSLAAYSAASLAFAAGWAWLTRSEAAAPAPRVPAIRLPLRRPLGWLLVAIFACMGSTYYGVNAWLPDAYVEHGWSEEEAGILLAVMTVMAIPASVLIPWASDRTGSRRPWLIAIGSLFVATMVGLVLFPDFGYPIGLLFGVCQGGMFALVMMLPLDLEERPDRIAALVAMMLGLGYTLAALSPFVLGAVRDLTGSFDAVLWLTVGFVSVLLAAVIALPHPRQVTGRT